MNLDETIQHLTYLIFAYYAEYRNTITVCQHPTVFKTIYDTISYNMNLYFPDFKECCNIEILEFPYSRIYLLNNGDPFPKDEILFELIHYVKKHHHIINNYDIVISINVVPFDGLDIRHGDILNMLDRYFL